MVLRPQQGNLKLVFRLFISCSAKPRKRLNNLKTCLRFPYLGLNTIRDSIILHFSVKISANNNVYI